MLAWLIMEPPSGATFICAEVHNEWFA